MLQKLDATLSRAELVYTSLRDSICDCTLAPGVHLVQEELAEQLGVSRQPIQQAMLVLKNEGLVVELGGRGLCVAPLDAHSVRHRYQIRLVLDQLAARLVAERAANSAEFARRLREEGEALVRVGDIARENDDHVGAVAVDVEFHTMIYRNSGNPLIETTAQSHWVYLRRMMILVLRTARRGEIVWKQHRGILDALIAGDVQASERLATQHVSSAQAALLVTLGESPELVASLSSADQQRRPVRAPLKSND